MEDISNVLGKRKDIYFTIQGHLYCTENSSASNYRKTKKRKLSLVRAEYIYEYFAKKQVDLKDMKFGGMRHRFPLGGKVKFDRCVEVLIFYITEIN